MVTGFRIGAAIRKVSASPTPSPRIIRPRAIGTLPHSQTGKTTPSTDSTTRRRAALRGSSRHIRSGNHTCTRMEMPMPRNTKGSDSTSTLTDSVMKSRPAVGSHCVQDGSATSRRPIRATTTATPIRIRSQGEPGLRSPRAGRCSEMASCNGTGSA